MKWEIKQIIKAKTQEKRREEIIQSLLRNRGITGKENVEIFLSPHKPKKLTLSQVGINRINLQKAVRRIEKAIKVKENIIIYGDYDADGICSTAILWETLNSLKANVLPFIPHREKHGYGLSKKGIDDLLSESKRKKPTLIITVDNGIVAYNAVNYAQKKGVDVLICDHHQKTSIVPNAHAIVHTTLLAGAGVTWMFAKEIVKKSKISTKLNSLLDLAAIGTVADMVSLVGPNRSIVKHGLESLQKTQRVGLLELFLEAGLNPMDLGTYHINFMIAPRINAMGRLEHALDSLRLLCTKDKMRAKQLISTLNETNKRRQLMTEEAVFQAKELYDNDGNHDAKIIIIDHSEFHEGLIGLVAGKMVESYYRPAIIISKGKRVSKASARSISGFNIIEAIRQTEEHLIDAGGHPMAAGFTLETKNLEKFKTLMIELAEKHITEEHLEKRLSIDCEISGADIHWDLLRELKIFEPFGMGNSRPTFAIRNCNLIDSRGVGMEGKHLKLTLECSNNTFDAIGFNRGFLLSQLSNGSKIDIVCTLDRNEWKGRATIQLLIKDILSTQQIDRK